MTETRLLICGEQVPGDGTPLDVENPFTEETIASVGAASAEQVDAAVGAAREASRGWAATPAIERAELLARAREQAPRAHRRARRADDARGRQAAARERGRGRLDGRRLRLLRRELGRNFGGRVIPSFESTQLSLVLKEPMGVVGCIVPSNYPLLLLAWKLAPALAAGNATVCKPSELTPLSTLALAPCLDDLPPGVVNLLAGAGDVGEAIVRDERVDCPLVSRGRRDRVAAPVEGAVAAGAALVAGGDGAGHARGHFFAPAIVTGAPRETDLLREESFGQVAPTVPVKTLDEAIALANGTRYELGCNVDTRDLDAIFRYGGGAPQATGG